MENKTSLNYSPSVMGLIASTRYAEMIAQTNSPRSQHAINATWIYPSHPLFSNLYIHLLAAAHSAPIKLLGKNANTVPNAARIEHTPTRK